MPDVTDLTGIKPVKPLTPEEIAMLNCDKHRTLEFVYLRCRLEDHMQFCDEALLKMSERIAKLEGTKDGRSGGDTPAG